MINLRADYGNEFYNFCIILLVHAVSIFAVVKKNLQNLFENNILHIITMECFWFIYIKMLL